MNLKSNSAGMLLFTIVACLVMSFTCATLATLILNQGVMIENEIKRKEAMNIARAGYEYAYDLLCHDETVPSSVTITSASGADYTVNISRVVPSSGDDDYGVSDYRIEVDVEY